MLIKIKPKNSMLRLLEKKSKLEILPSIWELIFLYLTPKTALKITVINKINKLSRCAHDW